MDCKGTSVGGSRPCIIVYANVRFTVSALHSVCCISVLLHKLFVALSFAHRCVLMRTISDYVKLSARILTL